MNADTKKFSVIVAATLGLLLITPDPAWSFDWNRAFDKTLDFVDKNLESFQQQDDDQPDQHQPAQVEQSQESSPTTPAYKTNVSSVTVPKVALDQSTPSGKALATVDALLRPSGRTLGTANQVLARIEPHGYKAKGGFLNLVELREIGGGQVHLQCGLGGKACRPDSEVTKITFSLKGPRSTYELYGDLIPKAQAYMRSRLGRETSSSNITGSSADLSWEPPSNFSNAKYVNMTVREAYLIVNVLR